MPTSARPPLNVSPFTPSNNPISYRPKPSEVASLNDPGLPDPRRDWGGGGGAAHQAARRRVLRGKRLEHGTVGYREAESNPVIPAKPQNPLDQAGSTTGGNIIIIATYSL